MDFLIYAYLQVGNDRAARQIVDNLSNTVAAIKAGDEHGTLDRVGYASAEFPALYAVETHHWADAAALETPAGIAPLDELTTIWARAIGAGHLRNAEAVRKELRQFDAAMEWVRQSNSAYMSGTLEGILRDEISAWLAFAEKNNDDALRRLRRAADQQDVKGKREVDVPAREMLADMLLELNRPTEALAEYEQSMKVDPNRFNGLYGAARAAELAGQLPKAKSYYATLLKNCANVSSDRPELTHARTVLAQSSETATASEKQ